MRRAVPVVVALVAASFAAGCGGGTAVPERTSTSERADRGREVMTAVVAAAHANDAEAVWSLLSASSKRRVGPTVSDFARGEFRRLRTQLAPFSRGALPVDVSERITERFGLVALQRGPHAYATPLRLEGDTWRVELGGPLRIEVSGPPPGSRGKFAGQVAVEVLGPGAEVSVLYLDGVTLEPKVYSGPTSATVYANFGSTLTRRRHTAVAFAASGNAATATAWTFLP